VKAACGRTARAFERRTGACVGHALPTTRHVRGNRRLLSYRYDRDGLLIHAGPPLTAKLWVDRSPDSGLPQTVSIGPLSSQFTVDQYGETTFENHTNLATSTVLYDVTYTRDKLGRIVTRAEVIDDVTRVFEYRYDTAVAREPSWRGSSTGRARTCRTTSRRTGWTTG